MSTASANIGSPLWQEDSGLSWKKRSYNTDGIIKLEHARASNALNYFSGF